MEDNTIWEINVRYFPGRGLLANRVREGVGARLTRLVDPATTVEAAEIRDGKRRRPYIKAACRGAHGTVYIGPFAGDLYVTSTTYYAAGCFSKALSQHDELNRDDLIILSRAFDSAFIEGAGAAGLDWEEGFSTATRTWCVPGFPLSAMEAAGLLQGRLQALVAREEGMRFEETEHRQPKKGGCLKTSRAELPESAVSVSWHRARMTGRLRGFGRNLYAYTEFHLKEKSGCLPGGKSGGISEFELDDVEMLKGAWLCQLREVAAGSGRELEPVERS